LSFDPLAPNLGVLEIEVNPIPGSTGLEVLEKVGSVWGAEMLYLRRNGDGARGRGERYKAAPGGGIPAMRRCSL